MKTSKTFLILLAAAAVSGVSAFAADSTSTDKAPPPHRQGPPPPPSPEMKAYHEKVLALYDVDKNGVLDEDERAVHQEDVQAGKFPPPPRMAGGRGPGGPGGPGGRMGPPPEILAKYDTNKDGKLDDAERAVLEKDIADGKLPPPPHGRGPHGAGAGAPPPPPPADAPAN